MEQLRTWKRVLAEGEPEASRNKHAATIYRNRMLVFGGYCQERRSFLDEMMEYNFTENRWSLLKPVGRHSIRCRRAHSMTCLGDWIFVFGGYDGTSCLNDMWVMNMDTKQWLPVEMLGDVPSQRGGHSAVLWRNFIVIHGGWDVGNHYFNDTYLINLSSVLAGNYQCVSHKAQCKSNYLPQGRVGHSCVLLDEEKMLMFGGYGGQQYWDDLNILDLATYQWKKIVNTNGTPPSQRTFATLERCGNRVLLVGGSDHAKEMNDVMIFDIATLTWKPVDCVGEVPDGRFAHTTVVYNHRVYLYGGITSSISNHPPAATSGLYELTLEAFSFSNELRNMVKMFVIHSGMDYHLSSKFIPPRVLEDLDDYRAEVCQMSEYDSALSDVRDTGNVMQVDEITMDDTDDGGMDNDMADLADAAEAALNLATPDHSPAHNASNAPEPPSESGHAGSVVVPNGHCHTFSNFTAVSSDFVPCTPTTVPPSNLMNSFFLREDTSDSSSSADDDDMCCTEQWMQTMEDDDWAAKDGEAPFFPCVTPSSSSIMSPSSSFIGTPATPASSSPWPTTPVQTLKKAESNPSITSPQTSPCHNVATQLFLPSIIPM